MTGSNLNKTIKAIYDDLNEELQLGTTFNPLEINGAYAARRSLLESIYGGADYFVTEGVINRANGNNGEDLFQNMIVFQGWRHDSTKTEEQALRVGTEEGSVEYETSEEFQL